MSVNPVGDRDKLELAFSVSFVGGKRPIQIERCQCLSVDTRVGGKGQQGLCCPSTLFAARDNSVELMRQNIKHHVATTTSGDKAIH